MEQELLPVINKSGEEKLARFISYILHQNFSSLQSATIFLVRKYIDLFLEAICAFLRTSIYVNNSY